MKVLIAVDESCFAEDIGEFVTSKNWPPHTEFNILNVVAPVAGNLKVVLPETVKEELIRQNLLEGRSIARKLAIVLRDAFHSEHIYEKVVEGSPKEEILKNASELDADLIILGSHGRKGWERMMIGGVSQSVLSHSPCSVIVVRPGASTIKEETAA